MRQISKLLNFIITFVLSFFVTINCFSQTKTKIKPNSNGIKAFFSANLLNKNVYKTQDTLKVVAVYKDNAHFFDDDKENIDYSNDTLFVITKTSPFIRYKVVREDDDNTYIRILKGCDINTNDSTISIRENNATNTGKEEASLYIYKIVSPKTPENHYLASSALVGLPMILPLRYRKLENETKLSGSFNLSYAFGWKFKIGNHPFHNNFLYLVPYSTGISVQKYFYKDENNTYSEKVDELSLTYYSGGISYQWEKFNVGIFAGKDIMFGSKNNWVYNNKWWIGLGLGYELFKEK